MQHSNKIVIIILTLTFLQWGEAKGQWLTGYGHRNKIELLSSAVSGSLPLIDFPLLIHMSGPELRTATYGGEVLNPSGRDIRFTLEDGTLLDFDMEFYGAATGNMAVWVRIPSLSPTENFIIYVYYGNSSVDELPPGENVWTSEYRGIWHMSYNTLDATQYINDGTDKATVSKDGKIGLSRGFNGIDSKVYVPYGSSLGIQENLSIEAWLRYTDDDNLYNGLITKQGDYELWYAKDHLMFIVAGGSIEYPIELEEDDWYHICATYDRSMQRLFLNGTEVSSLANTTQITNDISAGIGLGFSDGQESTELSGDLDEVRISSRTLSQDWIKTTYSNQDDPSAFSSYISTEISNDFPCSATLINVNDDCALNVYSNLDATISDIPRTPCNRSSETDTWFKVEVPAQGNLLIKLESGATPEIPTEEDWLSNPGLAVYHGTCENLSYDTCWVDSTSEAPFLMPEIQLSDYNPGDTLFLKVWGANHAVGKFRICAVADDVGLSITCPEDIVSPMDPDRCSATLTIAAPTVSSGNGISELINDFNGSSDASDTYPAGITLVKWTVTNNMGNQATCYHSITVFDTLAPDITCLLDHSIYVNDQCEIVVPDYTDSVSVVDFCDPAPIVTQSPLAGSIISGGVSVQEITISASDSSDNTSLCQFNLLLLDTISPSFTCMEDQAVYLGSDCKFFLPDYSDSVSVNDNCDSDPVVIQSPEPGTILSGTDSLFSIEIIIQDEGGNIAQCQFNIHFYDTLVPVFICPQDVSEYLDDNCEFSLPDYSSNLGLVDNCDPDPIYSQTPPAGTKLSGSGTRQNVVLSAVDRKGNTFECRFTVTLLDNTLPEAISIRDTTVTLLEYQYEIPLDLPLPEFSDNCGIASVVNNQNGGQDPSGIYPYGTTIVDYLVSDINGNTAQFSQTITVIIEKDISNGLIIPEAFSPNEDGINDRFEILGIEQYTSTELRVFNAHGIVVFQQLNYDNSWDGRSSGNINDGKKLPTGTYYYVLHPEKEGITINGFVYIKRE